MNDSPSRLDKAAAVFDFIAVIAYGVFLVAFLAIVVGLLVAVGVF